MKYGKLWIRHFTMLVILTLTSLGLAQSGWTPAAMIQFKRMADIVISPDGRMIAYTVSTPMMEGEKSEFLTHVWVVSADGTRNEQFTRGEKSCTNPQFSPEGRFLAFLSDREEARKNQIYLLPLNGGEAEKLSDAKSGVNDYAWSPDGKSIAYTISLCVMGWSYGGYMTSFIITKSNQFKVASVGAGIANLMSFTGTAGIPGFLPDYFGGEP